MANNRMLLVHRPTGLAVFLGKRMAWGWYTSEGIGYRLEERISSLFEEVENSDYTGTQDDFALAMEVCTGAECAIDNWSYGPKRADKLIQLVLKEKEA